MNCHFVVIRSGDKYMFDDISDDEMEVQTEMSDEQLDLKTPELHEYEPKKPGPLEVCGKKLYLVNDYSKN